MGFIDPHSFADADQPLVRSVALELHLDFATKTITASADYVLKSPASGLLDFDTRDLVVEAVTGEGGESVAFDTDHKDAIKGQRLRMHLQGTVTPAPETSAPRLPVPPWGPLSRLTPNQGS